MFFTDLIRNPDLGGGRGGGLEITGPVIHFRTNARYRSK